VVQAFNEGPMTEQAHVVLPASPHSEDEGTFVNLEGRIQRFCRAFPPRGDSQPHWKWAEELGRAMGIDEGHASSREVFRSLAAGVPELAPFDWDAATPESLRKGINPAPSGADGRVPGYREVGVPRVRGI